jgi:putative nucleotidyltransferase-like protein
MPSVRAERQLTLLSAGTAARRAAMRGRAAELMRQVDWTRLAGDLRVRRLLGALGPRVLELAGESADAGFVAAVEQEREQGRRRGLYLQLACERMIAMLAEAGIRSAALKGPQLSEAIYGDPGRRVSGDIDLLAPAEQLHAAVEVVRTLGYAPPSGHLLDRGLPLLHLALVHERGELPTVELHWRIHWYESAFARERLLPPSTASAIAWRPQPADELAALLLFYARDGFVELRLASDLSAWWDTYGADLPDAALEPLLQAYPSLRRALLAACRAAAQTVGLPADDLLGRSRKPGLRERAAARLADPNPRTSRSQLYADMGLIDGLLCPPGDLRAFVRRQLLPPREVLDEQARHGERRRARSRLARCVGVLGRYVFTCSRLLRAPETVC